jgi:hypothetical protein
MKTALFLFFIAFSSLDSLASTSITTASVSGHWTMAGSPYKIFNDILIDTFQSLEIDPGVQVLFQGKYRIVVMGSLTAIGTPGKIINFTVSDTTGWDTDNIHSTGGWHGIQYFEYFGNNADKSKLKYCNFTYTKFTEEDYEYTSAMSSYLHTLCALRSISVENCDFHENKQLSENSLIRLTTLGRRYNLFFDKCTFYKNYGKGQGISIQEIPGTITISNSKIYNNDFFYILLSNDANLNLENNEAYENTSELAVFQISNYGSSIPSNVHIKGNKVHHNHMSTTASITCHSGNYVIEGNLICNNDHSTGFGCPGYQSGAGLRCGYDLERVSTKFVIRNNIIANNYSNDEGGGMVIYGGGSIIANNIIGNNKSPKGAGIYFHKNGFNDAPCTIENNIFFGNINTTSGPGNIQGEFGGEIKYEHNWTQHSLIVDINLNSATIKGDNTTNILGINPALTLPTSTAEVTENALIADFSLSAVSQCIDKGDILGLPTSYYDYALNNRIYGSSIDIGPIEFGSSLAPIGLSVSSELAKNNMTAYPNPATETLYVTSASSQGVITLLDITGRRMANKTVSNSPTCFDIRTLPRGVYIVMWEHNNQSTSQKIILE